LSLLLLLLLLLPPTSCLSGPLHTHTHAHTHTHTVILSSSLSIIPLIIITTIDTLYTIVVGLLYNDRDIIATPPSPIDDRDERD
jgi:hypothetical protein